MILAIETTGPKSSVAIINSIGEVYDIESKDIMNHLKGLIPMIDTLLKERNVSLEEIDAIATSEGPGSFTGIRIGISTARAIGQARNIGIVSVPTLEAFVFNLPEYRGVVCPLFDARREQVYSGAYYLDENNKINTLVEKSAWNPEHLLTTVIEEMRKNENLKEITFFGDGLNPYGELVQEYIKKGELVGITGEIATEEHRFQKASSIAKLARLMLENNGKTKSFNEIEPVYMRKSEAEIMLEKTMKQ